MKINVNKFARKTHYWGAFACALPILIVIVTGIILQLKKEVTWVQPATMHGVGDIPKVSFDQILAIAATVEQAGIANWADIDRLDVRPQKGVIKVRAKNRWEIQIDHQSLAILQVSYRRSDLIESIHDGSFFHDLAKLWLFLPAGIILLVLWVTGLYLFVITWIKKNMKKRRKKSTI